MNIFHGVNVPIPCNNNMKKIKLNRSCGGLISIFARSIVMSGPKTRTISYTAGTAIEIPKPKNIPLKFNSSFGKLFASHAGVSRTGFAKNGARSTSVLPLPSTLGEMNTYAWEMHAHVWNFYSNVRVTENAIHSSSPMPRKQFNTTTNSTLQDTDCCIGIVVGYSFGSFTYIILWLHSTRAQATRLHETVEWKTT